MDSVDNDLGILAAIFTVGLSTLVIDAAGGELSVTGVVAKVIFPDITVMQEFKAACFSRLGQVGSQCTIDDCVLKGESGRVGLVGQVGRIGRIVQVGPI